MNEPSSPAQIACNVLDRLFHKVRTPEYMKDDHKPEEWADYLIAELARGPDESAITGIIYNRETGCFELAPEPKQT